MVTVKRRGGNSQQLDLGNKGDLPSLSSGQEGRGAGGEVKVTSQGREETSEMLVGCASPGKRLRGVYFPMPGLIASSPYLSSLGYCISGHSRARPALRLVLTLPLPMPG